MRTPQRVRRRRPRRRAGTRTSARTVSPSRSSRIPGSDLGERRLERVVGRLGGEHEMRLEEVAAEPGRQPFELGPGPPGREALEEVADEVPLGEPLDQADLLDPDRDLTRHRPRQLDAARAVGDDEADQLVVGDERRGDAAAAGAGRELRAELRERDRRARLGALRDARGAGRARRRPARSGRRGTPRRRAACARRRRRPGSSSSSVSIRAIASASSVSASSSRTRRRISP